MRPVKFPKKTKLLNKYSVQVRFTKEQIEELNWRVRKYNLHSRASYIEKKLFDLPMIEHPAPQEKK